jgi:homocitrate synthase NifV
MKGVVIMIQIVDNTLMMPMDWAIERDDLYRFCELLFIIGVDTIEIPAGISDKIESLPEGKYLLHVSCEEEAEHYSGFFRYVSHQVLRNRRSVLELQINDVRELLRLKNYQNHAEVRISGLDDLLCHSYEKLIPEILHSLPDTKVIFNPENTYGCACALALQWLLDYGKDITTSFTGVMNNAATEEILMALRLTIRHKPNRDLTVLPELTKLYERMTGRRIGNRKPILGKNIFRVEAGIHADGLHKNPVTYEAYAAKSVGGKFELVIGKHSGSRAVKMKLEQLKIPIPSNETVETILDNVRDICTQNRKSLSDEEFIDLLMGVMTNERDQAYC